MLLYVNMEKSVKGLSRTHASDNKNHSTAQSDLGNRRGRSTESTLKPVQRMADGAVQMDASQLLSLQGSSGNQAVLQMMSSKPEAPKLEDQPIQRQPEQAEPNKMPQAVQSKMERSFGADFSDIRIQSNSSKASDVGALAYTQGTDIHFAPGQYDPHSSKGQHLLGHELTHVIQQKAGRVSPTAQLDTGHMLNDSAALESEADLMGARAANAAAPPANSE
jgi:hypothetical protein